MSDPRFHQLKRKLFHVYDGLEEEQTKIILQKNVQTQILSEIKFSQHQDQFLSQTIDLTTAWVSPEILRESNGKATAIYKNWTFNFSGLSFRQLAGLRHNINFKFGEEEILQDIDLSSTPFTNRVIQPKSDVLTLEDTRDFDVFYGVFITDNDLEEFNEEGLQLRLHLTFLNTYLFQ